MIPFERIEESKCVCGKLSDEDFVEFLVNRCPLII